MLYSIVLYHLLGPLKVPQLYNKYIIGTQNETKNEKGSFLTKCLLLLFCFFSLKKCSNDKNFLSSIVQPNVAISRPIK